MLGLDFNFINNFRVYKFYNEFRDSLQSTQTTVCEGYNFCILTELLLEQIHF